MTDKELIEHLRRAMSDLYSKAFNEGLKAAFQVAANARVIQVKKPDKVKK